MLVDAQDYEYSPDRYHKHLSSGVWTVTKAGIPLSVWRKRQRVDQQPWKINRSAINQAAKLFGVDFYPLSIERMTREGGRGGDYILFSPSAAQGFCHRIRFKNWLDADAASRTLHHEIEHACQASRVIREKGLDPKDKKAVMDAWNAFVARQRDGRKTQSENDPIEIQARAAENRHENFPLTTVLTRGRITS